MTYDVQALRRDQFPWTAEHIYLDHASIGPLPSRTLAAVEAYNRERAAPYRLNHATLFDVLTRARAIEYQCYLLAPAQFGRHDPEGARESYGHARIIESSAGPSLTASSILDSNIPRQAGAP